MLKWSVKRQIETRIKRFFLASNIRRPHDTRAKENVRALSGIWITRAESDKSRSLHQKKKKKTKCVEREKSRISNFDTLATARFPIACSSRDIPADGDALKRDGNSAWSFIEI